MGPRSPTKRSTSRTQRRDRCFRFLGARSDTASERGYSAFITAADGAGVWTIQSSIFPETVPSLVLHDRAGFRTVGRRERMARMSYGPYAGRWRDTILVKRCTSSEPE